MPFFKGYFILGERILNHRESIGGGNLRHKEKQYKSKILSHRIILVICCIAVVVLSVVFIKSCTNKTHRGTELNNAVTEEESVQNPNEISEKYYENSVFIGNSFVDDMMLCDFVKGADYFAKVGLNVHDAMTEPTATGKVPVIDEISGEKKYRKIFMMFGENELGWQSAETFVKKYGELVDKAREYQKDAEIYLLAITPITKKVSDKNEDCTNNERINEYNALIKKLAEEKNVIYADIHSALAGEDGTLPDDAASDGIHFGKEYYKKFLLYIQNNYQ